jgi:integrase
MPPIRRRKNTPSYCLHKTSGRAYVTLDGKPVYLGDYGTPESRENYDRAVGEWMANGRRLAPPPTPVNTFTIAELLVAFKRHAEEYHRNTDRTQSGEFENYILAMRPIRKLYSATPVAEFGPLAMKNVRREMVAMDWARTTINRQLGRLRHIFNWGAGEGIIPASIADAVAKVKGLRFGKADARETDPIEPVADAHFAATLPHLPPMVRSMVELQIITGMRPGELCAMRNKDIEAPEGKAWRYCPKKHKTAFRGAKRSVLLGPKAREIIAPYMSLDPEAHLFSAARSEADRHAQQRENRKTRVQPSQVALQSEPPPTSQACAP